jgi:DNA-directed RNA polymerase II subunit RPB2
MLHSRYCVLNGKPKEFLRQSGECPYDHGGYFIIGGSEKVLITRQEQAFNTLYITPQKRDPKIKIFSSITCLNPKTRLVKRVTIMYTRREDTIQVGLPFVRKPIPLFVLFRALGFQSDKEILQMIYPDFETPEAKLMIPKLHASIVDGFPFTNTFTAIQYIKTLTKGYGEAHVIDILRNQFFVHMPNDPTSQALFLADCVRKILRVHEGFDTGTDRDDTRNQRCLTSGFLIQMLFSNAYNLWKKSFTLTIAREYEANRNVLYSKENFIRIFDTNNAPRIFAQGMLTESIMRGFKGKWDSGLGEEKSGVLQALSRLSYCDFISHCRRVILDFDTGMKLTGPRKLHPSQYGYFCTNETPGGASIGIAKNLNVLTAISTASELPAFSTWLRTKGRVYASEDLTVDQRASFVPVYMNNGLFGFTAKPQLLTAVIKLFKRSGCLPHSISISFSIRDRKVYIFMDEGRPLRPLIWLAEGAVMPKEKLLRLRTWRDLVLGTLPARRQADLDATDFFDPFDAEPTKPLEDYAIALEPYTGAIEYVDPYEHNETYVANYPEYIQPETTHVEVHPSTIMSIMTSVIPFSHHNQSPRNQLSCSQSKQGVSYYTSNWQNRFDNIAHVLCYGEAPLVRTMYMNYLGEGRMPYGMNITLAIACWTGYNQEDGIVFNYDAFQRGLFRSIAYRSYELYEEDDEMTKARTRIGNPANIASWKDLKPGLDYTKLDDHGIIRVGEYCDENTVLVGAYMTTELGTITDSSLTPQVWTRGRVEKIAITVNNLGYKLVKIRVVQDRMPELGDKFSNRHGQKGTIGAMLRGHDMPRTINGIVPDMIMNPHAIPSRMTIAQNLEQLLGKAVGAAGAVGDGTAFMNDGSPEGQIGSVLEKMGFEKYGNEVMYNGATGEQIPAAIFIGPVYGMRLKHMVEDKWQARGKGRKEQRTHQPTGGRGNQGGLKIGEMDRDAIIAHSMTSFFRESYMERSDGFTMPVCTSCGTLPIYNPRMGIAFCPLCSGPARFVGDREQNLELLPPVQRQKGRIVNVEIPYATKVLQQELESYTNIGMRFITTADTRALQQFELSATGADIIRELPGLILPETNVPELIEEAPEPTVSVASLAAMGADVGALTKEYERSVVGIANDDDAVMDEMGMTSLPGIREMSEANIRADEEANIARAMTQAPLSVPMFSPAVGELGEEDDIYADMPPLERTEAIPQPPPQPQPLSVVPPPPAEPQETVTNGPPAIQLAPPVPGANQTIVVDTSPDAMAADNLPIMAQRRAPVRNNLGGNLSGGGPGLGIQSRPLRMGGGQGQVQTQQQAHPMAHVAVTVNKLG